MITANPLDLTGQVVAFDTETKRFDKKKGLHFRNVPFICGAIATSSQEYYFIDPIILGESLKTAKLVFAHNAPFDWGVLHREGCTIPFENLYDTKLAAFLLDSKQDTSLKALAEKYLTIRKGDYMEEGKEAEKYSLETAEYCKMDAKICLQLAVLFLEELGKDEKLLHLYLNIDSKMQWIMQQATEEGIYLDKRLARLYTTIVSGAKDLLHKDLAYVDGKVINLNSGRQVAPILYRNLEKVPKTKTGFPKTDQKTLASMPKAALTPAADKYMLYKKLESLTVKFLVPLPRAVDPDGRIHPLFNFTRTDTGRLSCGNKKVYPHGINIQQAQKKPLLINNKKIYLRSLFIPPEGHKIVSIDASMLELRVLAHCSNDSILIDALSNGKDLHRITAAQIYQKPVDKVTDDERSVGKTVNFAVLYGSTDKGLVWSAGMKPDFAKKAVAGFWAAYPGAKKLHSWMLAYLYKHEEVFNLYGRKRRFPGFNEMDDYNQKKQIRSAFSAIIQGSAADLVKECAAEAMPKMPPQWRLFSQIHDEFNFYVPDAEVEDAKVKIKELFETNHKPLRVPLIFDVGFGKSWHEAKGGTDESADEMGEGPEISVYEE